MHSTTESVRQTTFRTNGFHITAFSFLNPQPERIEKARLEVCFTLSGVDENGTVTLSPFAHDRGKFMLFDQGENDRLTRWLKTTGDAGAADIYQFDYHDLLRLVTPIANEFMRSGRIDVSLGIPPQEVE